MKKVLSILCFSVLSLSFSGCVVIDELSKIGSDVQKSYDNAAKKAEETVQTVTETKAKLEEKLNQINEAKDKIKDAATAVGEIVK